MIYRYNLKHIIEQTEKLKKNSIDSGRGKIIGVWLQFRPRTWYNNARYGSFVMN